MWTPTPGDGDEEQHGRDCTPRCEERARYAKLTGPRTVPCPWCRAEPGQACHHGHHRLRLLRSGPFHPSRVEAA